MTSYMLDLQQTYSLTVTGIAGVSLLVFVAWIGFARYPLPRWLRSTLSILGLAAALILFVYLLLSGLRR
jgi:hypothetical protein